MTATQPLVSVIVPYFDQAAYLPEAVASVLSQTYENTELVIVDDCSPGKTAEAVLHEAGMQSARVVRHQENLGPSAARNTGVAHSRGEYLLPLDADDLIEPAYLAETVPLLVANPEAAAVYTSVQLFGDCEDIWHPQFTIAALLSGEGSPTTFLVRRTALDALGGYKPHLRHSENTDLWISAFAAGMSFLHHAQPLYKYRRHPGGQTSDPDFIAGAVRALVREHKELCLKHLEEILVNQTEKYYEQTVLHRQLYQEYMDLHAETTRQYEQIMEYYSDGAARQERSGLLGKIRSFFQSKR